VLEVVVGACLARVRLLDVVAVHHLEGHVAQTLGHVSGTTPHRIERAWFLAVVAAVAEEVVGAGHAGAALAHEAWLTHAHFLPSEALGPLKGRAGVLPAPDAIVIDTAVLATGCV